LQDWITIGDAAGPQPEPWKGDVVILATIEALSNVTHDERMRVQLLEPVRVAHHAVAEQCPAGVESQSVEASSSIG
jgi:hypothetical protein